MFIYGVCQEVLAESKAQLNREAFAEKFL